MTVDYIRDRARALFEYLRDLEMLRSKRVIDCEKYEAVFWFADMPQYPRWTNIALGLSPAGSADVWIEATRIGEPPCPEVPKECAPWVDPEVLRNADAAPTLRDKILAPDLLDARGDTGIRPRFALLADRPDVTSRWEAYVSAQWRPWAEKHKRWAPLHSTYRRLYAIYKQQAKLQEEYELVLGLGLLYWQTPGGQLIRRHLLVGQAEASLDLKSGTIRVGARADGVKLTLETDMLEPSQQPRHEEELRVRKSLDGCAESPWDIPAVESVIREWIHAVDSAACYQPGLEKPRHISEVVQASFSPAIILRRRSGRSLLRSFESVIEEIRAAARPIPFGIRRICEIIDDHVPASEEQEGEPSNRILGTVTEVYLPLPANEEQHQIVERLGESQGVLVQGPPGTGKSHTIANLICHLLATGSRVLVTSQTPRALQVLTEKIPAEVRPLCVCVLGSDREAMDGLHDSVTRIAGLYNDWDRRASVARASRLEKDLHSTKEQIADILRRQRELREKQTYVHTILGGAYWGTAQSIAGRLAREADSLSWIPDRLDDSCTMPFGPETFKMLWHAYQDLPPERCRELSLLWDGLRLPDSEQFIAFVRKETEARDCLKRCREPSSQFSGRGLDEGPARGVIDNIATLQSSISAALNLPMKWGPSAVHDVLSGTSGPWHELLDVTRKNLAVLRQDVNLVSSGEVPLPEQLDPAAVRADAEDLLTHLEAGGRLGWWVFAPQIARRTRYLREMVRVSGRPCDNPKALRELLAGFRAREALASIADGWSQIERYSTSGLLSMRVAEAEERVKGLDVILRIETSLDKAAREVEALGLDPPVWHDRTDVSRFCEEMEVVVAHRQYERARAALEDYADRARALATNPHSHPTVREAAMALESRDPEAWGKVLDTISALDRDLGLLKQRDEWERVLRNVAPGLVSQMSDTAADQSWGAKVDSIGDAWRWAQADSWLREFNKRHNPRELEEDLASHTAFMSRTSAALVAEKAWLHCFERMNASQRMSLVAFAKAMKKLGKSTGKYAAKYRRDAETFLEGCRDAIPAWVMPLYRVAESGLSSAEIFDVVIIDEASQSGPEALLLLYIAKKVVVVGDDQQISPSDVGLDLEAVHLLIEKHLKEIPFAATLGGQSSIFQQGEIRFGGRIVLREHFRCMPEIIRFSNLLCYSASPLRCLRQYPPNRLEPIQTVYVPGGYREGYRRAINRPEATALANRVADCCRDPSYLGKSMGVISLLGEDQARLIQALLFERLAPEEIEKRRLVCGDAYAFQGNERDVMFLSMVAAPNERIGALVKESDKQRFNVAASRARDQLWLFHSCTLNDLNPECMRHRLLSYMMNPEQAQENLPHGLDVATLRRLAGSSSRREGTQPAPFDSWFEADVFLEIAERGYRVVPQYQVSSYHMDLVVEGFRTRLAIECDGDIAHPPEKWEQDAYRQRVLERCGWTFWRLRGSEFYRNPGAALKPLWERLTEMDILPGAQPSGRQESELRIAAEATAAQETVGAYEDAPDTASESVGDPEASDRDIEHEGARLDEHALPFSITPPPRRESRRMEGTRPIRRQRRPAPQSDPTHDDLADMEWAATIPAAVWFSMSHWAKVEDQLVGWERKLLFSLGTLASRGLKPSVKQARQARRLYDTARNLGFSEKN